MSQEEHSTLPQNSSASTSVIPSSNPKADQTNATIVYLAMHSWFATGEGWAYHPEVDLSLVWGAVKPLLRKRIDLWQRSSADQHQACQDGQVGVAAKSSEHQTNTCSAISTSPGEQTIDSDELVESGQLIFEGKCLCYVHYPDRDCPDPKARSRYPTILIVAVTDRLSEEELPDVKNRLRQLAKFGGLYKLSQQESIPPSNYDTSQPMFPVLPDRPGPCESFFICVPQSPMKGAIPSSQLSSQDKDKPRRSLAYWYISLLVLSLVIILVYLEWPIETSSPFSTQLNPRNYKEHKKISSSQPARDDTQPKSKPDSAASEPRVSHPHEQGKPVDHKWKHQAATVMLHYLKSWKKHTRLTDMLGPNIDHKIVNLLDDDLENINGHKQPIGLQARSWPPFLSPSPTAANVADPDKIIARFFLVLSQKPVKHLLSENDKKDTWQGKFLLRLPEEPIFAGKGSNVPTNEQELRAWLLELGRKLHIELAANPESGVEASALKEKAHLKAEDLIKVIGGEIDFETWRKKVSTLQTDASFRDCTNKQVKKWVEGFQSPSHAKQ